jgi:hypothetical protein
VQKERKFVNKEHQLNWMAAGGARELNALLTVTLPVKVRIGQLGPHRPRRKAAQAEQPARG